MIEEAEKTAIAIVDEERRAWEKPLAFVTKDVAFDIRKLIETVRKNYWGVFEKPYDEATGREKFWFPMTMRDVEIMWKNSDIDLKDMMFMARSPEGVMCSEITRHVVRNYLEKMYFGETLDETLKALLIDGTVVWKTWEEDKKLKRRTVDLLNFYIDPSEDSIQTAYRVTERSLALPGQVKKMTGWKNTDEVSGTQNADKNNTGVGSNKTTGKYTDVWETWGKIPLWLVTLKKADKESGEEVDGHIVVSGFESGKLRCHLIEKNTKKDFDGNALKPYEEGRLTKITGRWYGLGTAEREIALQEWLNTTGNARINRQIISQLGLFKMRKDSGITPQMVSQLSTNGVIPLNNMEDFQQLNVQEPGPASYTDEQLIKEWAQAITQAHPIASGESVPASQTATTSAIQNTNAKSSFSMVKDAMEFLLKRWMDRHALPIIAKSIKKGDVVRIIKDVDGYKELAEKIVAYYAQEYLSKVPGDKITPMAMEMAFNAAEDELRKRPQLFIEATREIVAEGLEVRFFTNDEQLDTQSLVQNLIGMSQIDPEARESYMDFATDIQGLPRPRRNRGAMATPPPESPQTVQDKTQLTYGVGQGNSAAITQG